MHLKSDSYKMAQYLPVILFCRLCVNAFFSLQTQRLHALRAIQTFLYLDMPKEKATQ